MDNPNTAQQRNAPDAPVALIVGAPEDQRAQIEVCLPDWQCVPVPVDAGGTVHVDSESVDVAIVCGQKSEKETVAVCEHLRRAPQVADAGILLIITRYMMAQAHAIDEMGNTAFMMTPLDQDELRQRVARLRNSD